jgi:hypothetical protein
VEQPYYLLNNGTRVRVHDKIKDDLLLHGDRSPGAFGRIAGVVGGLGGDVYFVTHDSGTTAKYCFTEFELENESPAQPPTKPPSTPVTCTESDIPRWFGEDDGVLGIQKRCIIHVGGDVWLSDGRCAFLMPNGGVKTRIVKDFADVIQSSIRKATQYIQEGNVMFEPDTPTNRIGYSTRNFVVPFGTRFFRGLHVALVRRLYGDIVWATDPADEQAAIVAFGGDRGQPVAIITPLWSA